MNWRQQAERATGLLLVSLSIGMLASSLETTWAAEQRSRSRPNIILITAESMGYGDLGVNGQKHVRTPRLDRFASEGLRFTNYYAGGTEGLVSRASALIGKHTGHNTIRGARDVSLASLDLTLGELAQRAGYYTGALGKWGLGGPGSEGIPTVQGFNDWFGYLREGEATNHFPVSLWRNQTNLFWAENANGKREDFAPYLFTKAATNFITLHQREPFFLSLAYAVPSAPLQSPTDKPFKDKAWPGPQKTLAAMTFRLDREVGRILDTLAHLNLEQRTVVFFAGATGPHSESGIDPKFFNSTGGHRGEKGTLYEGGLRVPLLVRWPGVIKPGRTSGHVCASWDLFPTIANLMGLSQFDPGDGISLTPTLLGRRQTKHSFLYWEHHDEGVFGQALRSGDWKLVRSRSDAPWELFRLDRDPAESNNLAKRYSRTVRRLERLVKGARTASPDWPSPID